MVEVVVVDVGVEDVVVVVVVGVVVLISALGELWRSRSSKGL